MPLALLRDLSPGGHWIGGIGVSVLLTPSQCATIAEASDRDKGIFEPHTPVKGQRVLCRLTSIQSGS